jgi:hypothetical protein
MNETMNTLVIIGLHPLGFNPVALIHFGLVNVGLSVF